MALIALFKDYFNDYPGGDVPLYSHTPTHKGAGWYKAVAGGSELVVEGVTEYLLALSTTGAVGDMYTAVGAAGHGFLTRSFALDGVFAASDDNWDTSFFAYQAVGLFVPNSYTALAAVRAERIGTEYHITCGAGDVRYPLPIAHPTVFNALDDMTVEGLSGHRMSMRFLNPGVEYHFDAGLPFHTSTGVPVSSAVRMGVTMGGAGLHRVDVEAYYDGDWPAGAPAPEHWWKNVRNSTQAL